MRLAYQKVNPSGIPNEYTELLYLQTSGSQYIDTGIDTSASTTVVTRWQGLAGYASGSTGRRFFASYSNSSLAHYIEFNASNKFGVNLGGDTGYVSVVPSANTLYECYMQVNGSSNTVVGITINGTAYSKTATSYQSSTMGKFVLFRLDSKYTGAGQRVGANKLYINNSLVRSFVPAKRNSDGVLGMYDLVTDAFYTNAGTGTFIAGSEVTNISKPFLVYTSNLPKEYQELDYIENTSGKYADTGSGATSNVGSYINTGIHPTANGVVKMKLQFASYSGNAYQCLFGAYDTNTKNFGVVVQPSYTYFMDGNQTNKTTLKWKYDGSTDYEIEYSAKGKYLIQNGQKETFSVNGLSTTSGLSIYLFTDNSVGSGMTGYDTTYTLKGKIYYFQYLENNIVMHNLVPAKRLSDNVIGMYDTVSNTFLSNQGIGTFTAGDKANPILRLIETGA